MTEELTSFIYGLKSPESDEIRYVGKADNPRKRFGAHLRPETANKDKRLWISRLRNEGLEPELVILEEVPRQMWKLAERMWIRKLTDQGHSLLNLTEGTGGPGTKTTKTPPKGFRLSPEARELLKALAKDLGISQASVVEMAVRMLDRTFSGKRIEPEK